MKLWRSLPVRRQTADAPNVVRTEGASTGLSDWPTPLLDSFRRDLATAFERARDADDQRAVLAALRLIGRVETELANRR